MSLHLDVMPATWHCVTRARSILTCLAAVFMRCAMVLMGGQTGQAVAVEVFVVCAAISVAGLWSVREVRRSGAAVPGNSVYRTVGSITCYSAEMLGAIALFIGTASGLYIVAAAMVSHFFFMISGSWLLLVGVTHDEASSAVGKGMQIPMEGASKWTV